MKASNKGWDQCGNAQAVANEHQIILAGSDPFLLAHAASPVAVVSACLSRWFQRPAL
jgi:hypothetical protein